MSQAIVWNWLENLNAGLGIFRGLYTQSQEKVVELFDDAVSSPSPLDDWHWNPTNPDDLFAENPNEDAVEYNTARYDEIIDERAETVIWAGAYYAFNGGPDEFPMFTEYGNLELDSSMNNTAWDHVVLYLEEYNQTDPPWE